MRIDPPPDSGTAASSSEDLLHPQYCIPIDSDFVVPSSLDKLVDPNKVVQKILPKQGKIERLIKHINWKVLLDTHLPGSLKDLKGVFLTSL